MVYTLQRRNLNQNISSGSNKTKLFSYTYFGYIILISVARNCKIRSSCFDAHEKKNITQHPPPPPLKPLIKKEK